ASTIFPRSTWRNASSAKLNELDILVLFREASALFARSYPRNFRAIKQYPFRRTARRHIEGRNVLKLVNMIPSFFNNFPACGVFRIFPLPDHTRNNLGNPTRPLVI